MKKLNYLLLGLAGLTLASCSQDDLSAPGQGDGTVSFTINLPGDIATRAIGDGTAATKLQYAVYEVIDDVVSPTPAFTGTGDFGGALSTKLTLNLINSKSYQIAFFAQSAASMNADNPVYEFNAESHTLNVNYEYMTSEANNADAYDCFIDIYGPFDVTKDSPASYNVTLTRPVAQINWGANDIDANDNVSEVFGPGGQYVMTELSITGVYTTLDLLTGKVGGQSSEAITIGEFAMPTGTNYPVNSTTYQYLALQYLLAPASSSNIYNFTLNVSNAGNPEATQYVNKVIVSNAPVQANYRTNIYGALLTNSSDFDIDKSPDWGGSTDSPTAWDGEKVTTPMTVNNNVLIAAPSDLAGLAKMVSDGNNFAGKTIVLNSDLDMGGYGLSIGTATYKVSEYNPMGTIEGTKFSGTFDGQGHTISNLKIESGANTTAAFIPVVDGGALRNVNFENVSISGNVDGSYANETGIVGIIENGGSVSGVTVSGTVSGVQFTSGVVGVIITKGYVSNCTNNATVNGSKYVGGVVGGAIYCTEGYNMSITNCHNTGNITSTNISDTKDSKYVGGIVGMSSANIDGCTNTGNVTNVYNSTGGIAGEQRNAGYIKNCVNKGNISESGTTGDIGGSGGIVGFVRCWNYNLREDGFKNEMSEIVVSGNTNYGSVEGNIYVGGIVGEWYYGGICTENTNYAPKISATGELAAGIIGTQQYTGDKTNIPTWGTGASEKIVISYNKTSTPLSSITAPKNTDIYVWVNTPANVVGYDTNSVVSAPAQ